MKQYFTGVLSLESIKKLYYKLAFEMHPDHGGSQDAMKELNR